MALKAIIDNLDDIPEALREHYAEKDGAFYLALDDFGKHPGAVTLKATLNKLNREKADLAAKVAEWEPRIAALPEDFDPADWERLKSGKTGDEALAQIKEQHQRAMEQARNKHAEDLARLAGDLQERDSYIDRTTRQEALRKSLREAGIDPTHEDLIADHLARQVKVAREETGERRAFVETDIGEVGVADFVADWAKSKGKPYLRPVSGPDAMGGGRRFAGEANPFAANHWNKTAQAQLPADKREAMARAAGFKDYAAAVRASQPLAKA